MIMGVERNLNKQAGLAVHKDKDHQLRFSVQPNMQALVHILVLAHFCLFIFPSRDVRGDGFDKCVHILIRIHALYLTMEMSGNSIEFRFSRPCRSDERTCGWVFSDKEMCVTDKNLNEIIELFFYLQRLPELVWSYRSERGIW